MKHEARHDEILAELLTGASPRESFEASELASCAACRELAEAHLGLAGELDAAGGFERAQLAALADDDAAIELGPAEAEFRRRVLRDLGLERQARGGPGALLGLLVAAAALVALLVVPKMIGGEDDDGGPRMGGEKELLAPVEVVPGETYGTFRWRYPLPERGWFLVQVHGEDGKITTSPRLRAHEWTPDPEEEASWPDRIRWTLEVYDGSRGSRVFDALSTSAERSSD